jgi:hypothetical protein
MRNEHGNGLAAASQLDPLAALDVPNEAGEVVAGFGE